ncbi:hypothetical protein [Dechloromonas denitrificans]|uniref:hypothetical protein n=1 Tax=Dechloromonas denitrificans TaxID=281362 RepID=UPI001CF807B8|nr:hypothetical protein [Dechloromonas denitrificans]UCV03311.1 hypothetical protein KI611_19955 [Dechloromonas denitrificans]
MMRSLPLPADVYLGIVEDLYRRGIVTFDIETSEVYLHGSFTWHRVPGNDEMDPWSRQVRAAVRNIQSARVRNAVETDLLEPPLARVPAVVVHSNLLTALPSRGGRSAWSASEMLVAFALAINPEQTPAGVFRPSSMDSLAAFASLPPATLIECVNSLAALGAVAYDPDTGEIFSAARLRCASGREHSRIAAIGNLIDSHLVFHAFAAWCARLRIKINKNQWLISQVKAVDSILGDVIPNLDAARKFHLRHGLFKEGHGV